MNDEYLEKVSKQKIGYNELDKFVPGEAGLQYFPVPKEEHDKWRKDQDRKNMEAYEKREREKNNAVLEIREEEVRGNGHDKPKITFVEELVNTPLTPGWDVTEPIEISDTIMKTKTHCDLKKKSTRKRASNSKSKK